MSLLTRFQQHINYKRFFQPEDQLMLACSGGIDSVVLCDLLSSLSIPFSIAHMNFQLRGAESERDANFVRQLASSYGVNLYYDEANAATYAAEHSISIQVAARELRYSWFNQLLDQFNAKRVFILTAHHSDDAIETSVMNFFRGTGIRGLTGIPERNNGIIRPMLAFSREEIVEYASEKKLVWVEDSSNASVKYTRNFIRHEIIPAAEKIFPAARKNLLENLRRFNEVNTIYQEAINRVRKKLVLPEATYHKVPVARLINMEPLDTIVFECFQPFGFHAAQTHEIISLCHAESGRQVSSATHTVTRNRNWLLIYEKGEQTEAPIIVIEEFLRPVEFSRGKLLFNIQENHPIHIHKKTCFALLDSSLIQLPVILRKWKPGDYFYPFGMEKKKKVARFLIDQKVSTKEKENVYVLEMNKKILWVVGFRIDNRFRITDTTKKAIEIEFKSISK